MDYKEEHPNENLTLSRSGMPLGWMLYLGLPITAAGVLFALRLANLSAGWGAKIENSAVQPQPLTLPSPEESVCSADFGASQGA